MDKGSKERLVFQKFCEAVHWPNDENLIESRPPPEPDIQYTHPTDGLVAYELTEICSPEVAKMITHAIQTGSGFTWSSDPSHDVLRKKLEKKTIFVKASDRTSLLQWWPGSFA